MYIHVKGPVMRGLIFFFVVSPKKMLRLNSQVVGCLRHHDVTLMPFVAPVEQAVQWAHEGVMTNQGQCCSAGSRTFVHEDIYDEFVAMAKAMAENRFVGDPWDDITMQGPQVSVATRARSRCKDGLSRYGDSHVKDKTVVIPSYV